MGNYKTKPDHVIFYIVPLSAFVGISFAIIAPSFINAMDRAKYRNCLSTLSNVKTVVETVRNKTNTAFSECAASSTIEDCIAEAVINRWTKADNRDKRSKNRSCEAWGGGDWKVGTALKIIDKEKFEIRGRSRKAFNSCDICVTESGYYPEDAQECLSAKKAFCPHDEKKKITE